MNGARRIVFERRFPNDLALIHEALEPCRRRIVALAVESTYNWYWLVDGLQKLKYHVKLANPARMQENLGLKAANDKTDARFIGRQLTNGILPEGDIYPAETRGIRDLLRRRMRLVQARSGEWISLESLVARHTGCALGIRELGACDLGEVLAGQPQALLMAQASLRHIEFLDRELRALEKAVANYAVRYSPELRAWFQRKQHRSGKRVIALKALANKLAKACYFMLRDGKDFEVKRLVG